MTLEGHNIDLWPDWTNGFIYGGNKYNCLTWMDKMGSSKRSSNAGLPASSRDGAPIEMTALLYLTVKFMASLYDLEYSPYDSCEIQGNKKVNYKDWANQIKENFEKYYWVPQDEANDKNYKIQSKLVRRRGIYKDTDRSLLINTNYYLRPNVLIALGAVPGLFNMENADHYLKLVETLLLKENSIGVKTLDPYENLYKAYYDNSNDGEDWMVAQGFNYHNGPEWVWLYGYYLMSVKNVLFSKGKRLSLDQVMGYLKNHKDVQLNSDWLGLHEVTDDNGQYCRFSCDSQAWSTACQIEGICTHQGRSDDHGLDDEETD